MNVYNNTGTKEFFSIKLCDKNYERFDTKLKLE